MATTTAHQDPSARAFTLIECVISLVIVSGLLVASLNLVGFAAQSEHRTAELLRAKHFAESLMDEILALEYQNPGTDVLMGPELLELIGGRPSYNDVDDYMGLVDSPPRNKAGAPLPGGSGWSRRVSVDRVLPESLNTFLLIETGVKRISVDVHRNGRHVYSLTALRAQNAPTAPYAE